MNMKQVIRWFAGMSLLLLGVICWYFAFYYGWLATTPNSASEQSKQISDYLLYSGFILVVAGALVLVRLGRRK